MRTWSYPLCERITGMQNTCLGIDDESLRIKIKKQTSMGDIVVDFCYRPPDQEEQVDEALYRQLEVAPCSQALVVMGLQTPLLTQQGIRNPGGSWRAPVTTA